MWFVLLAVIAVLCGLNYLGFMTATKLAFQEPYTGTSEIAATFRIVLFLLVWIAAFPVMILRLPIAFVWNSYFVSLFLSIVLTSWLETLLLWLMFHRFRSRRSSRRVPL